MKEDSARGSRPDRHEAFDRNADVYDRVRPEYPEQVYEDIIRISAIPDEGRVLEMGCGTGQASLSFAMRGYDLLAVDIGARMAALAAKKLRPFPNARVICADVHTYEFAPETFDLVIAASSFHWFDPEVRFRLATDALRYGGSLAVFTNWPASNDRGFFSDVKEVYRRLAPYVLDIGHLKEGDKLEGLEMEHLSLVTHRSYGWQKKYDVAQYIDLLSTYSDHFSLPPERLKELLEVIADLIDSKYDGHVEKQYETELRMWCRV